MIKDNATRRKVWNYLISIGCNSFGAAGMIGNIYAESAVNPICLEKLCKIRLYEAYQVKYTDESYTAGIDTGKITREEFLHPIPGKQYGYGICQWTSEGRKKALYDAAIKAGVSIGNLDLQLNILHFELQHNYKHVFEVLKTAKTVDEASDCVLLDFEQPAYSSAMVQTRRGYSLEFYNLYKCEGKKTMHRCTASEFVSKAKSYIGYSEKASDADLESFSGNAGYNNYQKFQPEVGAGNGDQWCQYFVDAMAYEACGNSLDFAETVLRQPKKSYMTGYTPEGKSYFVESGAWYTTPHIGDVVYFYGTVSSEGRKRVCHVGIVTEVDEDLKKFRTVEGNTSPGAFNRDGGCVAEHEYSYSSVGGANRVNGFGRPAFAESPEEDKEEKIKSNVRSGQRWLNTNYGDLIKQCFGAILKPDGIYGAKTRAAALAVWKDVCNRKFDANLTPENSNFGEKCAEIAPLATVAFGMEGTFTYICELILSARGFYLREMDGICGIGLCTAIRDYEKAYGLGVDSEDAVYCSCGKEVWTSLFND